MPNPTSTTPKRSVQKKQNKLGPYSLLQTLGEGEFGKVKLGIHIETGQEVAIKLIKKEGAGSDSRINKVEREISVLKTLNHPYIVKLYNVVETEKYIGIILEYASGGELFEYILAHRHLKEKDAKRFFAQLISSVQYMHKRKIVHRDLKLENLLLDKNRNIIVTDFGFANQFATAADDMMATTCGSPCYAAPELVVNAGLYAGSAVDIWSCGVILYAMLCGFLPFDDDPTNPDSDNINQLYRYILTTNLIFPSHVGADAKDLLAKMLVPDPAKRCSLESIVKHPWLESYRHALKKDTAQIEMGRRSDITQKSDTILNSSASTTLLPRNMTAAGANAPQTRKTHVPVTRDNCWETDHNAAVVAEKSIQLTPKPSSNHQQQQKTSAFKHFSIGRSSATTTTTTAEKSIHAANVKTSKVPNFITRKPVRKEGAPAANDPAAILTVSSSVADAVHPEKSLSSPLSSAQRRGTDKFLSFFTGGRTSHVPVVVSQKDDEYAADLNDDNATSVITNSGSSHVTTEEAVEDELLAQDSAISSAQEESTSYHEAEEDGHQLLHSFSEASTLGGSTPSSSSSPVNHPSTPSSKNVTNGNVEILQQIPIQAANCVDAVKSSSLTIPEDQQDKPNVSNGSQCDEASSIIPYRQILVRERGSSIASILSEQGIYSSLHSSSTVSFRDPPRRVSLVLGSLSLTMRQKQHPKDHVRIDTGTSTASLSAEGHVDSSSLSSAGTCPQPEASNSTRLTAKYMAMGDGGRKAIAAVRRSIYRKHKSQPPPAAVVAVAVAVADADADTAAAAAAQQQTESDVSPRSNSQRNSTPVAERRETLISFAKSRFEETNTLTHENKQHQRHSTPIMVASTSEVLRAAAAAAKNKTGKKMMEWIKKKSHGKDNRNEVITQAAAKPPIPTTANKGSSRPPTQILTRSRNANTKKEPTTPTATAKTSRSIKTTAAADTSNKRNSKAPAATYKTRKTVISALASPPSPTVPALVATIAAKPKQPQQQDIVVPEQSSIRKRNRALSGSESAIAELNKKQGIVDDCIQIHQGAIDKKALTSQSPALVIKDVARILHILGIDTILESPYVLKCCRRKAKSFIAAELLQKQDQGQEEEDDDLAIDASSATSSDISNFAPTAIVVRAEDPIYGDASIDNGDEIRFVVEMCRFKNLPGLYIVDIRRVRGNAWAYKFLYHKLINFLDLGRDGYMQSSK